MNKINGREENGEDLANCHQNGKDNWAKTFYGHVDENLLKYLNIIYENNLCLNT